MVKVLVIAGRGFVGSAVVSRLGKHKVTTFDRHEGGAHHFRGSILDPKDVEEACKGQDVVINLAGLSPLRPPKRQTYHQIHVEGTRNLIRAAKKAKVGRVIHMSALGADPKAKTAFLRTKGKAEKLLERSGLKYNIMCPSLIYDLEHDLILLASELSWLRMFPNVRAKFQPVYRFDVADIFAKAVAGRVREKKLLIRGPETMSLFEFVKKVYKRLGRHCHPVPTTITKFMVAIGSATPLIPVSMDQLRAMSVDNTTSSKACEKYVKLTRFADWLNSVWLHSMGPLELR
jgi:uncharacterized protein YbjT (DUF2867 family)